MTLLNWMSNNVGIVLLLGLGFIVVFAMTLDFIKEMKAKE